MCTKLCILQFIGYQSNEFTFICNSIIIEGVI